MDDETRARLRERGMIPLDDEAAASDYERAVEAFANDGDRPLLVEMLAALGLTADEVQWHVAHPGQRMVTIWS